MKINKTFAAILIAGTMMLSGCSNNIPIEENSNYSAIPDPMKDTGGSQSNSTPNGSSGKRVIGSYSAGLSDDDVDFSTDTLVLTPDVTGDENPTTIGMMAFIDGIPRKYTLNDSADERTLSVVDTTPSTVEYTLELDTKFDTEFDTHYASMLYLLNPDFKPENGSNFGMYHSEARSRSKPINTAGKEFPKLDVKALKTESIPFTQKQIEKYKIPSGGGVAANFNLDDKKEKYQITLTDGYYPELTFAAYTTSQMESGKYRVTFYKNHEFCTFNSGYDCLDLTLESEKIVEEEIVFDEELHAGDFVYCVAIPLFKDGFTGKSPSKMVFDENGETSQTPQPSSSGTAIENSEPSQAAQSNSGEKVNTINFKPLFSNSDTIYFTENHYPGKLYLISSENCTDIKNTLPIENSEARFMHGDHISILFNDNGKSIAKLYDKDLKEIKSADLSELQTEGSGSSLRGRVDFDNDRIVYCMRSGKKNELYSCDWNLENKQKLMELPCKEYPLASYFGEISLSKNFVAFTAYGNEGNNQAGFYGVCDFNGNYKINRKDGIDYSPQTNDTMAMWQDDYTNINAGEMPSGKIEIYKDGKFNTLNTEEVVESHRAFLSNSGEIITASEYGSWNLREYSDGKVVRKIMLGKDVFLGSAVSLNGKIYMHVVYYLPNSDKAESKCLCLGE